VVARSIPEDGDIVVREEQREGRLVVVYVLHTAPGADQYVVRSRADAIEQAVTFAKRQQVRAWVTDGDLDFTLLEDFRAVAFI
jgi:LPS sulfotransferase NodH